MGFSLKGFAGGLADAGTTYIEGKQADRKDAKESKRTLMFNATENMYRDAKEVKKANDKLINEDKQYSSLIYSLDPNISKDNLNKLLSLDPDKRAQAEEEFNYRKASNENVTFGDFMTTIKNEEDLDNPVALDKAFTDTQVVVPKAATAYYDKSGLVPDYMVDDMYDEVSSVFEEIYGFSSDKAKSITSSGIRTLQYPPIKIEWSKAVKVQANAIRDDLMLIAAKETEQEFNTTQLINEKVKQSNLTTDSLRDKFGLTYMVTTKDDDGNDTTGILPKDLRGLTPSFEADFRKSPEYLKHVLTSATPYITSMATNPAMFKVSSMNYLNTAFPGVYGGEVSTEKLSKEKGEAFLSTLDPAQIYYLKDSSVRNKPPQATIATGLQIKDMWFTKFGQSTGNPYAGGYPRPQVDTTNVEGNSDIDSAEQDVVDAQESLSIAIQSNESPEVITSLRQQLDNTKQNVISVTAEVSEDAAAAAERVKFKARQKERKNAPNVYSGSSLSWQGNQDDLDIAIEERDLTKVNQIIDNLTDILDNTDLSLDQTKKLGGVRGDALRARNNMPTLLQQDTKNAEGDVRMEAFQSLQTRANDAESTSEVTTVLKEINAAIKVAEGKEDDRMAELNLNLLNTMKQALLRKVR